MLERECLDMEIFAMFDLDCEIDLADLEKVVDDNG
jgi:hypothetical protein